MSKTLLTRFKTQLPVTLISNTPLQFFLPLYLRSRWLYRLYCVLLKPPSEPFECCAFVTYLVYPNERSRWYLLPLAMLLLAVLPHPLSSCFFLTLSDAARNSFAAAKSASDF